MSVFSEEVDSGNPAAVCILEEDDFNNTIFLQKIAKKINLSEVSFVKKRENNFFIRWFSPIQEVDICGHGTIASFKILTSMKYCKLNEWVEIKSNKYNFNLKQDFSSNIVRLQLPIFPLKDISINEFLNVMDLDLIKQASSSDLDYIVEVKSLYQLKTININFSVLSSLNKRGLIVTYADINSQKIFYRYFCPKLGFNEDPGTGSALSSLHDFWKNRINFNIKVNFSQESKRKSKGFVEKLINENSIMLSTFVSSYHSKILEID